MFKGSLVALITPFRDGAVDEKAFQDFCEWQIAEGTHGFVVCGTTGEAPTMSHEEQHRVIRLAVEVAARRVPVIAGTGSNATSEAISLTKFAKAAGCDGSLVVTPYYNKPSQEGLYQHFKAVHDAADLPMIIYNIPPRSVIDMSIETMGRLARLPNVVGVKDATMDLMRPLRTRVQIGPDFCQLSGEDGTALAYLAQGGVGCISVTANVAPKLCAMMHEAWQQQAIQTAQQINDRLALLHDAMFCEPSPAPAKYAVSRLRGTSDEVRLPLVPASPAAREKVDAAMAHAGLV